MTDRDQFLAGVAAFLEYKKEEGVQTLEISVETRAALQPADPRKPAARQAEKPLRKTEPARVAAPAPVQVPGDDIRVTGKTLEEIAEQIAACTACGLCKSRNKTVPGEGCADRPDVMFIGEGPGADEDAQGRPFVGKAGQLLTKMIGAMGYTREQVYIANIVKCRPPGNRVPSAEEMSTCSPYLRRQIELIKPKIIVALGKTAIEGLLNKKVAITRFRGTWSTCEGIDMMPTFHPTYLLRSPNKKREAWTDLQAVLARLGKTPPNSR